jgi:hypothetical protein
VAPLKYFDRKPALKLSPALVVSTN